MGARYVASLIENLPHVSNVKWEYDSILQFDYRDILKRSTKTYKVYMPTRADYEVSIEVVDRAVAAEADLIVYDNWIFTTISGEQHALKKGIKVYKFGSFLNKVQRYDAL